MDEKRHAFYFKTDQDNVLVVTVDGVDIVHATAEAAAYFDDELDVIVEIEHLGEAIEA